MEKIFVALSGGVDSAVAAHILKSEGHDVTGVFIRVWQPDFLPCTQDEEERAALRVAAHLGIPFKRLDLSEEYKKEVVDRMITEYTQGRTPNPDVLCNAAIKFGSFLSYAKESGATKIATGHHAQVTLHDGVYNLLRGVDPSKDQAYFLWKLTQVELAHTLMPIGEFTKQQVREYAEKYDIPSASKPDSQGLCFIGHVNMKVFLKNFIDTKPGKVFNEKGKEIGTHDGVELVTIGQRGGFSVTDKSAHGNIYYVLSKNLRDNTLVVTTNPELDDNSMSHNRELKEINWITKPNDGEKYDCEIRYHGRPQACSLSSSTSQITVTFEKPTLVASGQSIVFYKDDVCFGGGIAL